MKKTGIKKSTLAVLEFTASILSIILLGATSIIFTPLEPIWNIIAIVIALAFLWVSLVYLPIYYKTAGFNIADGRFCFKRGFFVKRSSYMKIDNIVFVTVIKTPLTSMFDICTVIISATGGKIIIPFTELSKYDKMTLWV